ncbi:MAG: hypothetical protein RLY16_1655 [Bacteroidota bacterium]
MYYNFNGHLFPNEQAAVGPGNRGLRYGDGLFETMRLFHGKLQWADEHFARLWKGMQTLHFAIPKHFSPEVLTQQIIQTAKKNGHDRHARIRLTIIRGSGGLYDAISHQPNYLIETWLLQPETGEWNSNGLVVGIYEEVRKMADRVANLKHNNFLPYVMAALHAQQEKWNDALVLNHFGTICDSTIANVFAVKEGNVFTPALSQGCIAGIVREQMIHHIKQQGITIVECEMTTDWLLKADEVFLTNSISWMRWVREIGDATYGCAIAHQIYSSFRSTF